MSLSPILTNRIDLIEHVVSDDELTKLIKENEKLKHELKEIQSRIDRTNTSTMSEQESDDLRKLIDSNQRLKYRVMVLERSIVEEEAKQRKKRNVRDDNKLDNIELEVKNLFTKALKLAFPHIEEQQAIIEKSRTAHFQCSTAKKLTAVLKVTGRAAINKIGEDIVAKLPVNSMIEKTTVTEGFINIWLDPKYIVDGVRKILNNGFQVNYDDRCRIVIDYSSPNIAKEMHVGHLRSTIIGDCIANILEFLGNEVIRINHVGDWGTQFGMLLAHLIEKFPDYKEKTPPISDLVVFYKEAKKRFDEDEDFKKLAYSYVTKLQSKEEDIIKAWKDICSISRKEFDEIYNLLGCKNLVERGESFYHDMMKDVVNDLDKRKFIIYDDGRKVMFPLRKNLIPLTLVKSDGGFTYDTSDMACIKYRVENDKADRIIYVTDSGQADHFHIIFDCAKQAEYVPLRVRLDHVGFGVVLGEGGKKFKTRDGETVRLRDLLNEGLERARNKLIEKGRDKEMSEDELKIAEKAVAIGCIKYSDLSNDRIKTYQFSFDRMLDDRGNTAVYLLYSLARINSIIRKAEIEMKKLGLKENYDNLNFTHINEWALAKHLLYLPQVLHHIANVLSPHHLCGYLHELSVIFTEFYSECYCIETQQNDGNRIVTTVNVNRISLCRATAAVLSKGLTLLGIELVERM